MLSSGWAGRSERYRAIWGRGLKGVADDRLHRYRPVLVDIQGGAVRVSIADYPCRKKNQRRHGQVHHRADGQTDDCRLERL